MALRCPQCGKPVSVGAHTCIPRRDNMPNETIEQPKENCGLMLVLEGGVSTTINIAATRQEVVDKIQDGFFSDLHSLIQFKTANPNEEEICLIDPKRILIAMVKKEFTISTGKIVPATMGQDPSSFKH